MPLISIIIPIYNAGELLERCLKSIINQNKKNYEILLINDGSTDESETICKEFMNKNSTIKYFYQTNKGVSEARNLGIKESKGKWIVFVDADDVVDPNFTTVIQLNINEKTQLLLFDFEAIKENNNGKKFDVSKPLNTYYYNKKDRLNLQKKAFGYSNHLPEITTNIRTPWAKAYKMEYLKELNIKYDVGVKMGQDFLFNLKVLENIDEVKYIQCPVYYYFNNSASTTRRYKPEMENIDRGFYMALDLVMKEMKYAKELQMMYNASVLDGLLLYMQYYYFHSKNNDTLNHKKNDIHRLISSYPYDKALNNTSNKILKEYFSLSKRVAIRFIKNENITGLSFLYKLRNIKN